MRLDFNILWVEDQQSAVGSQRERIELLLRKEGFRLQVVFASSVEEAKGFLFDDIHGDHIDLILMDYNLGEGDKGDKGLVEVRNIFPYKDIVFYSSAGSNLLGLVAKQNLQGIFCSIRDDLPDTVDGLFEALVKKVLDIDHSRGIVMGATSDIDHYVHDCLSSIFKNSDDIHQKKVLKMIEKRVDQKRKDFDAEMKKLLGIEDLSELKNLHNAYTSIDRLRLLKNMLKNKTSYKESFEEIVRYLSETVPKRNDLAHVRVKVEGFSRQLFDRHGNELTSERMKSLRQELLEFQDLFESLSEQLNSSGSSDK